MKELEKAKDTGFEYPVSSGCQTDVVDMAL